MSTKITLYLSHPNFDNSFINKKLLLINRKMPNFELHHLDKCLQNGYFDLDAEKDLLKRTDVIVWQFPLYWYNCPPSLRIWQDQVLSPIVYSSDNFLKGKQAAVVFTAGATKDNYGPTGLNRYTAEEMLRPFEMTVNASGMIWHKPLGIYGCSPDMKKDALEDAQARLQNLLEELHSTAQAQQ